MSRYLRAVYEHAWHSENTRLVTKSGRLGENPSSSGSSTSTADDSLVERICVEGFEASLDRKTETVLKRLEVALNVEHELLKLLLKRTLQI